MTTLKTNFEAFRNEAKTRFLKLNADAKTHIETINTAARTEINKLKAQIPATSVKKEEQDVDMPDMPYIKRDPGSLGHVQSRPHRLDRYAVLRREE